MGSSESSLSSSQRGSDEITTVSERSEEGVDPILERLRSLKLTTPILPTPPTETSLTDILVRKPSSSAPATVDPKVLMELFSVYRDWHEAKAQKIIKKQFVDDAGTKSMNMQKLTLREIDAIYLKNDFSGKDQRKYATVEKKCNAKLNSRQEEMENKIEVADALAVKLLQRFNYSVSTMKTASLHLAGVHALQVEIGELKGRLTEVISNCDTLCKRINAEGPDSLRSSLKPFSVASNESETTLVIPERALGKNSCTMEKLE